MLQVSREEREDLQEREGLWYLSSPLGEDTERYQLADYAP
jgi:hypothetical protein